MAEAPVELLQRVPLFADFDRGDLQRLARSFKERTFDAGSTVAQEGKGGVGFFVIESGGATVSVRDEERAKLGPGDYFGEIALIDDGARSATITADLVESNASIAWKLLETLAKRLRAAQQR